MPMQSPREIATNFAELEWERVTLLDHDQDDGLDAEPAPWPKGSADGAWDAYPTSEGNSFRKQFS
jgi:hypothetical protein